MTVVEIDQIPSKYSGLCFRLFYVRFEGGCVHFQYSGLWEESDILILKFMFG